MLRLKARSITMHPGKAENGPSCLKYVSLQSLFRRHIAAFAARLRACACCFDVRYRGGGPGNAFDQPSAVAELDGHAEGLPDVVLAARGEA